MTIDIFERELFTPLAMQLRANDVDVVTIRAYHRVLESAELPLLKLAADKLARTAEWFPKSSEWLAAAHAIERERRELLSARIREFHKHGVMMCADCDDTGWRNADAGMKRCVCQEQRYREVIGLDPIPDVPTAKQLTTNDLALARVQQWAQHMVRR